LKVAFSIFSLAGSYVVSISTITFSLLFTEILYFSISKITFYNHFSIFSQKLFNTIFTLVFGTIVNNNSFVKFVFLHIILIKEMLKGIFYNLILNIYFLFSSLNYTKKIYLLSTLKSIIYNYVKIY